jgi:NAD(P)-dependent dehydrogenase (short-subunit alcohol dehydrogenase family)
MGRLQGQVAIVTGAGRGIGREIAAALASEGALVAVVSRTAAQVEETCGRIGHAGGTAVGIAADVADRGEVEEAVRRVQGELGMPTLLVSNAGSFDALGPVAEVDPEIWWHDVTVNLLGPFLCARAVLPGMIGLGRGRIVNMIGGGMAGPFPYGSGYASSKAALQRFTESLDQEVAASGVGVFAMGPGLVRTAMTELQVTTEAGKRWFGHIKAMFEQGKDVPPTRAAKLAVEIASGRLDDLHGRCFGVGDDLDKVVAAKGRILREDLKTLRFRDL